MRTPETQWPPLSAMWSDLVLMVLCAMTPQVATLVSPGSTPSVFREKCGDINNPWLLSQRDGVRMVIPQTVKPTPAAVQLSVPSAAKAPPAGVEVILT